jgi:hypothetical protein
MKTIPNLILVIVISLWPGCSPSHRFESQLLRPTGPLSVVVRSDTAGEISTTAEVIPRVTVILGKKDELTLEQVGKETFLRIRGSLWSRISQESKRLDVRFKHQEFYVEVDGVALPKSQEPEPIGGTNGSPPIRPEAYKTSSPAGSHG